MTQSPNPLYPIKKSVNKAYNAIGRRLSQCWSTAVQLQKWFNVNPGNIINYLAVEGYKFFVQGYGSVTTNISPSQWRITAVGADGYSNTGTIVTDKVYDLSKVSTITVDWEGTMVTAAGNNIYFVASTEKMSSFTTYNARIEKSATFTRRNDTLDVSGLAGQYYLRAHSYVSNANTTTVKVYSITFTYNDGAMEVISGEQAVGIITGFTSATVKSPVVSKHHSWSNWDIADFDIELPVGSTAQVDVVDGTTNQVLKSNVLKNQDISELTADSLYLLMLVYSI